VPIYLPSAFMTAPLASGLVGAPARTRRAIQGSRSMSAKDCLRVWTSSRWRQRRTHMVLCEIRALASAQYLFACRTFSLFATLESYAPSPAYASKYASFRSTVAECFVANGALIPRRPKRLNDSQLSGQG